MHPRQKIGTRPAYFDDQLLQAVDFIEEQRYHIQARRRHNMALHDWGVVSGLELRIDADRQASVQPGYAVDAGGREIDLPRPIAVDTSGWPPTARLRVSVRMRDEVEAERAQHNRIDSYAVVCVSDDVEDRDALLLGRLALDGDGRPDPQSIDMTTVRHVRTRIAPDSVGAAALSDELRRAWVSMPFHGWRLEPGPDASEALPPPFRQGATEARSHSKWQGKDNPDGAGGTMPIVPPFGARRLLRMRIAGVDNRDRIEMHLLRGGFDGSKGGGHHQRVPLLEEVIEGEPYCKEFVVKDGKFDPEWHTLALWVRCRGRASISIVSFEFEY